MRAATVVQQVCKSCMTCFKFYCTFYFTCDRSFSPAYKAGSLRTTRLPGTKPTYRPLPHKCETRITSVYPVTLNFSALVRFLTRLPGAPADRNWGRCIMDACAVQRAPTRRWPGGQGSPGTRLLTAAAATAAAARPRPGVLCPSVRPSVVHVTSMTSR